MTFKHFKLDIDGDGIATVTWDMPGRSMNVITEAVMDEIDRVIDHVAGDPAIKGCVVTSGKAAFYVDSPGFIGPLADPKQSAVADNLGIAKWPAGLAGSRTQLDCWAGCISFIFARCCP